MRQPGPQGEKEGRRRVTIVGLAIACICVLFVAPAQAAGPQITKVNISEVGKTTATLTAEVNPGSKETRWHFEFGAANCASSSCTSIPLPEGKIPPGNAPVQVEAKLQGLAQGEIYHFLVSAKNSDGGLKTPDRIFATAGTPRTGLPDGRAYEQASPVDKDGMMRSARSA